LRFPITRGSTPVIPDDLATKGYVDSGSFLPLTGGTMSGDIDMDTNSIQKIAWFGLKVKNTKVCDSAGDITPTQQNTNVDTFNGDPTDDLNHAVHPSFNVGFLLFRSEIASRDVTIINEAGAFVDDFIMGADFTLTDTRDNAIFTDYGARWGLIVLNDLA